MFIISMSGRGKCIDTHYQDWTEFSEKWEPAQAYMWGIRNHFMYFGGDKKAGIYYSSMYNDIMVDNKNLSLFLKLLKTGDILI